MLVKGRSKISVLRTFQPFKIKVQTCIRGLGKRRECETTKLAKLMFFKRFVAIKIAVFQ